MKDRNLVGIMENTELINNTLVVEDNDSFIVYSPFSGKIARVNLFPKKNSEIRKTLKERGFFGELPESTRIKKWSGFKSLTLLLTRKCNLDCIYCYAGKKKRPNESMSKELAMTSVDWFINQLTENYVRLTFHGGGEPTLEKDLIKEVVSHVNVIKENRRARFLITTNGTTSLSFLDWMMDSNFGISVSIDGPPDIQDRNRPFLKTGLGSSKVVERNVKYLVQKNYPFSARLTYSPVDDIKRIMGYFGKDYAEVEFGKECNHVVYSPEHHELLEDFFVAMDVAKRYGIKIFNSHLIFFTKGTCYFCGSASLNSMTVTHDGFLTACLEVVDRNDPDKNNFFFGRFNSNSGDFGLDQKKMQYLLSRNSDNLSECRNCFARYHCAGGCAVKAVRATGSLSKPDPSYCFFTKALVPKLVKKIAKDSKI